MLICFLPLVGGFLPPLLSGPLAAFVFMKVLTRKRVWQLCLFWMLLLAIESTVTILVGWLAHGGLWHLAFGWLCTPIATIGTILFMLRSKKQVYVTLSEDRRMRRHFVLGTIMIPLLQLSMMSAGILLLPMYNKWWGYPYGF